MTALKQRAKQSNENDQNKNSNVIGEAFRRRLQFKRSEIREKAQKKWQKIFGCAIVGLFLSLTFLFPVAKEKKSFTTSQELFNAVRQYLGQNREHKKKIMAIYGDPIGSWDVSQVADMRRMFAGAKYFNNDLSQWNMSSVRNMQYMFADATSFNNDLSIWNVSSVTNMGSMFAGATSFNSDLSQWDVSSVTNMGDMFWNAHSFNGNLSKWNVCSVTNMGDMFWNAHSFNGDLSRWNVSSVTNMGYMFADATAFNSNLSQWNVSSVTFMADMFWNARSFNGNLSKWNVSSVTNMGHMFAGAKAFNSDLSQWNVSSVTIMGNMFWNAHSFNGNLSKWNMSSFANNMGYRGDLNQWNVSSFTNMENVSGAYAIEITEGNFPGFVKQYEMAFVRMYTPVYVIQRFIFLLLLLLFNPSLHLHLCVFLSVLLCRYVMCQRLAPTWEKFAQEVKKQGMPVGVGKLDCVAQADLCREQKVNGFPTMRWYHAGEAVQPDYKMDRTVGALMYYAKRKLEMDEKSRK
jgi:surface protein